MEHVFLGGSGTVSSGNIGEVTFYNANGDVVSGTSTLTINQEESITVGGSATSTFTSGLSVSGGGLSIGTLDCSGLQNGGVITTDGSGNLICAPDDGGSGSGVDTFLGLTDTNNSF